MANVHRRHFNKGLITCTSEQSFFRLIRRREEHCSNDLRSFQETLAPIRLTAPRWRSWMKKTDSRTPKESLCCPSRDFLIRFHPLIAKFLLLIMTQSAVKAKVKAGKGKITLFKETGINKSFIVFTRVAQHAPQIS